MDSNLKDQWYQLEEQYRVLDLKEKKQNKTNGSFNKLQPELDKKNRELIQSKEKLEQEKKIISKKKDKSQSN